MIASQARAAVVQAGRRLLAEGLVARTWGNVSVRVDDRTMAVTPSGIAYPDLTEERVVLVDLVTGAWSGPDRPSGERAVHRAVYRRRPQVLAAVHTHQAAASVCAAARVGVETPFGAVPCAPYGLPGTRRLTEGTVGSLGAGPAVLMANHGAFAVGASLDEAFARIAQLERSCAAHVAAHHLGGEALPAPVDAPWDPACLTPVRLDDGTEGLLSAAPYTARFAALRRDLPPVLDDVAQLTGRRVRCVATLPRRRPRADAVLVAGRGALAVGADAEAVAMVVEKAARAWIGGTGFGGASAVPGWEALLMRAVYTRSYSRRAAAVPGA